MKHYELYEKSEGEKSRTYGPFRGTDFSDDPVRVARDRLSDLCNMYKDYDSGGGQAVETVPGFRRRMDCGIDAPIYGIHSALFDGERHVLIHVGHFLLRWENHPAPLAVTESVTLTLPAPEEEAGERVFTVPVPGAPETIVSVRGADDADIRSSCRYADGVLTVHSDTLTEGAFLQISYRIRELSEEAFLADGMNEAESRSFTLNGLLYLLDGRHFFLYDGHFLRDMRDLAAVPTTVRDVLPAVPLSGKAGEARNLLTPLFRHTFVADGTSTVYHLRETGLDSVESVTVNGTEKTAGTDYTVDLAAGTVTFAAAPAVPETLGEANVVITARKLCYRDDGRVSSDAVTGATVCRIFDGRVFLSGSLGFPGEVFYCRLRAGGLADPSYFGAEDRILCGTASTPVTGMLRAGQYLIVLRSDADGAGAISFHTPKTVGGETVYPASEVISDVGCSGACRTFFDDPVFVSPRGIDAVSRHSTRYERSVEHRSTLLDAALSPLDLLRARLTEWNGYLVLLCGGRLFLADSRARFKNEKNEEEYEWFSVSDVGVFDGQYPEYRYAASVPDSLLGREVHAQVAGTVYTMPLRLADAVYVEAEGGTRDLRGKIADPPDADGETDALIVTEMLSVPDGEETVSVPVTFAVRPREDGVSGYEAFAVTAPGNAIGGRFRPATAVAEMDGNLFFGTENGILCSFNFDQRAGDGTIPPTAYSFDGRTIFSSCATASDDGGEPTQTKTTVRKATVVRLRTLPDAAVHVMVRTDRTPYHEIARLSGGVLSFSHIDFADFSFLCSETGLFTVPETEKRWMEKQYAFSSDEYQKPFALFYISYRYKLAGKPKGEIS